MTEEEIRAIVKVSGEENRLYVYSAFPAQPPSGNKPVWYASLYLQGVEVFAHGYQKQEAIDAVWEKYVNRAGDRSAG